MKTPEIFEKNAELGGIPKYLAEPLQQLLTVKHYHQRKMAIDKILSMGNKVLPHLHKLTTSGNEELRKIAAKIIEQIADKKSIPALMKLLDDSDIDIRWVAAHGLVKIGRPSIIPLLKFISIGDSSSYHRLGAHHVFAALFDKNEKKEYRNLLRSLKGYQELSEIAPIEISKALKAFLKKP